ncbi:MAG: phosphoribosylanthranilate isomerase [Rhizobiales bacterium]|nr:phosphoribosylanthranilate isomerase [Hyphomicrobiales bacterium]
MPLIVKICGLKTAEALDAALDAGADMVGFVFFPKSPRNIALAEAAALAKCARGKAEIVALTVDAGDATLSEIVETVRPDWLQLHGAESTDAVAALREAFGLRIMKALPISTKGDLTRIDRYAAVADRLLFDAHPPKDATRPGGLGQPFDWHLLDGIRPRVPYLLSGGLDPSNVAQALAITNAPGVDVSSGVERSIGEKDPDKIRAFVKAARAAMQTPASVS